MEDFLVKAETHIQEGLFLGHIDSENSFIHDFDFDSLSSVGKID